VTISPHDDMVGTSYLKVNLFFSSIHFPDYHWSSATAAVIPDLIRNLYVIFPMLLVKAWCRLCVMKSRQVLLCIPMDGAATMDYLKNMVSPEKLLCNPLQAIPHMYPCRVFTV